MRRTSFPLLTLAIAAALGLPSHARAADFDALSLEDLMQVEVTSVSKKPQRLATVAAAVFVISAEDIRLSGAQSLPEAMRLAPGMDVTQTWGNHWAVSARGFAGSTANKLLVLVDGRNAYNPAFSGVLWADFQFPLEDVERIEVIRGPAAAIWGTNGVNGVINIITKSAASTQGGEALLGHGNFAGNSGRVRWGGASEDGSVYYRAYASGQRTRAARALDGGDGEDAVGSRAAGFRFDGYLAEGAHWDMSGDFHATDSHVQTLIPLVGKQLSADRSRGVSLRARFDKPLADGASLQVQGAFVHSEERFPTPITDQRDTFDLDLQHRLRLGAVHDVVWGINYRYSSDHMLGSTTMFMNTPSLSLSSYGAFAQDEISLAELWRLSLGLRMDHNSFTGWEPQPTARLAWNFLPSQTLWGALSRASRAPSRGERGFNFVSDLRTAPLQPPVLVVIHGAENYGSERLEAEELGLRSQWAPGLSTDLVVFQHHYDKLRMPGAQMLDFSTLALGYITANVPIHNGAKMTLQGAELAADWRLDAAWRVQLAQTWNHVTSLRGDDVNEAGQVPKSISSLRLSWTPTPTVNIDAWWRHTAGRPGTLNTQTWARNAYSSFDLRLAWRARPGLELSLIGQNLNDGACDAYTGIAGARDTINAINTCMPRSIVSQLRVDF